MTKKITFIHPLFIALFACQFLSGCNNKNSNYTLYERELKLIDSVQKAYNLSIKDSSTSDFFMKEVRYRKFGVSIYRLEDKNNNYYLFGILKNDTSVRIFPLIDNRLLEQEKLAASDTNQLDYFLKEVLRMNGDTTSNWFERHEFISGKILIPILDLHEIHLDMAEKTLERLKKDTSQLLIKDKDCRQVYIKTYEFIIAQQKNNAPKFYYKHPKYDNGLIYEIDFANNNGDFKVRYLNEKCFSNFLY